MKKEQSGERRPKHKVNAALKKILATAYPCCPEHRTSCRQVKYGPKAGYVPRGFTGAFGVIKHIQLILCLAEPGTPNDDEAYDVKLPASELIDDIANRVAKAHQEKNSPFHKNICKVLDFCWPDISDMDEQLKRTWITETVLCSAGKSAGKVPKSVEAGCGQRFLKRQLELFPSAFVIALGKKAERRLHKAGRECNVAASALGRPEGSKPCAVKSWARVGRKFRAFLNEKHSSVPKRV